LTPFKRWLGGDTDEAVRRVFPFIERIELSPDTLTLIGTLLCGCVGTAFWLDRPILAGLGLMLAGWCDLVDGVVARRQGRSSLAGGFLDSALDRLGDMLLFGGIALGAASRGSLWLTFLALWAATAAFLVSYARARAEVHLHALSGGAMGRFERFLVLIFGAFTTWLSPAVLAIALVSSWTAVGRLRDARACLEELERTGVDPTAPEPLAELGSTGEDAL
jgi:phosphatidylglycerophosphate synthase